MIYIIVMIYIITILNPLASWLLLYTFVLYLIIFGSSYMCIYYIYASSDLNAFNTKTK
jgi:hypothetical protein